MKAIASIPDLFSYDKYLIAFSGGKDSQASLLALLDAGVDRSKIELWHHNIDGREGSKMMDWACTESYCSAFAKAFNFPIYFSWRTGGFEREMLRNNQLTGAVVHETPEGTKTIPSQDRPKYYNTREKFPQVSPDLSVRWCSSYLKIDVMATSIRNQKRFNGIRTLVITGERGQESAGRAKYEEFEPHRADLREGKNPRHVDHFRPIKNWNETDVWEILGRWKINVHPAYWLGFGRVSCLFCIFGNGNQFASAQVINPEGFEKIANYENQFGKTIKRKQTVRELAGSGMPYQAMTAAYIEQARSTEYDEPIILEEWTLPKGAYGESCGSI